MRARSMARNAGSGSNISTMRVLVWAARAISKRRWRSIPSSTPARNSRSCTYKISLPRSLRPDSNRARAALVFAQPVHAPLQILVLADSLVGSQVFGVQGAGLMDGGAQLSQPPGGKAQAHPAVFAPLVGNLGARVQDVRPGASGRPSNLPGRLVVAADFDHDGAPAHGQARRGFGHGRVGRQHGRRSRLLRPCCSATDPPAQATNRSVVTLADSSGRRKRRENSKKDGVAGMAAFFLSVRLCDYISRRSGFLYRMTTL
jgi:hypothetical protein